MYKFFKKFLVSLKIKEIPKNNKINLLIELDTFDKGGLQKVVLDSAVRFNPDVFNITIISINQTGYLAEIARQKGIEVYELPALNKTHYYEKILKERRINLSNSHFSHFGYSILKKNKIPNVTFIHNVYAFLAGEALDRFIEDDKYVDIYISVSNKCTEYAVQRLGIEASKIRTIPNGLIIEEHTDRKKKAKALLREDFGLSDKDYVFINPASYNLHKAHYLMIDAMKKILKVRTDIKILCVGNVVYEPHYKELSSYLKETGLNEYILLPGYYPNIEDIYPIVDAFLMPSFIEGWSIAMNEAMFYGKPLLMTNTGGAADVIENEDIGLLIENEYGDTGNLHSKYLDEMAYTQKEYNVSDQLAAGMINFASNKEYWMNCGKKGRDKIINLYDFDDVVEKYENVYKNLLNV